MSRTAATGRSGSSADLPSRPDRPRQEIGLHKQNQTPTFPAGFPRRVLLPPQCLQGGRTCRAGEVVGRPMVAPTFIAGTAIKFVGAGIAARLSQSSPHLVGADALMPSEEGCSIPFPPGRRKLHIRSLLLPFRKPTASLGRLSVDIGKERERPKPGALPAYPSSCRGRRLCRPVGQYDLAEGFCVSDVQCAGRTGSSAPTNRI